MQRRHLMIATLAGPAGLLTLPLAARAHHGWSSFDQDKPLYLSGTARKVAWRNPHVEFDLELTPNLQLPADLAQRQLPAQSASVAGPKLLADARLPTRKDKVWHIELAPLTRMDSWKVPELKNGDTVAVLGYTTAGEKGDAVLRVEYLFMGNNSYGLRSSPA